MSNLTTTDDNGPVEVSKHNDEYLRADPIIRAINESLPEGVEPIKPIPKDFKFYQRDRAIINDAFDAVFYLLGGASAFAHWAQQNPKEFYTMWAKRMPADEQKQTGTTVVFQTNIPASPLDSVAVKPSGGVYIAEPVAVTTVTELPTLDE